MDIVNLQIISSGLLEEYRSHIEGSKLSYLLNKLKDADLSSSNFNFYNSVASVYSSKIEGEAIELDSYIKHKCFGIKFQPNYIRKTDDLYQAYQFAKETSLDQSSIAKSHILLTQHILPVKHQGKVRSESMCITSNDGCIEYIAAPPIEVRNAIEKLYADIDLLLKAELSVEEAFFFASMIHLAFVKIHPWYDGNGRSGRLLEKCFLAEKLGKKAWFVQSEKYYYEHHQAYYDNIKALGLEYDLLDFGQALRFLLMLPQGLIKEGVTFHY